MTFIKSSRKFTTLSSVTALRTSCQNCASPSPLFDYAFSTDVSIQIVTNILINMKKDLFVFGWFDQQNVAIIQVMNDSVVTVLQLLKR